MHARKANKRAMTASRSGQVQPGSRSQILDPRPFDEDARILAFLCFGRRATFDDPTSWIRVCGWEIAIGGYVYEIGGRGKGIKFSWSVAKLLRRWKNPERW